MPTWGGDISGLDLDDMYYYVRPSEKTQGNWEDVPDAIKSTFDKLGIPEAERKFLAGVGAQYESEMVYHSIRENLDKAGRDLSQQRRRPEAVPRHLQSNTSAR